MLSDQELLLLNARGFLVGPHEDEIAFMKRVQESERSCFPEGLCQEEIRKIHERTKEQFDIAVDWVPIFYSNRGLHLWEGAATWSSGAKVALQLKEGFKKGRYLYWYQRDEILEHELIHAARTGFDEPRFEESFAYLTSKNRMRKYWGPLFRSSKEVFLFLGLLSASMVLSLIDIAALLLPCLFLFVLSIRLRISHLTLWRAYQNLCRLPTSRAFAILLRLTDQEVSRFSRFSPRAIQHYASQQSSFRWRLLTLAYPELK